MTTETDSDILTPEVGTPAPARAFARRIALAFAVVAALTAALSAILISSVWNYQFDQYLRGNLQRVADGIAQIAQQAYPAYGGWTLPALGAIPRFGAARGVGVQILDANGEIIYDDATNMVRPEGLPEITDENADFVIQPQGPLVTAPVIVNSEQVGTVRVWAYGAGAVLTDRDEQFRRGSFAALTIAALVAIIFASIAGMGYANRLVKPIECITDVARELRAGHNDARTNMTGDDEIAILGRTLDEMADAIEADRQLERRLTADVAHELRTPLQAIQATVEAMQDGVLPADEERLGVVRDETVRLGRLADAILELTRLERGTLPFDLKRIDLGQEVRTAVGAHEALVESADLTLSVDITEGLYVLADADRIRQAVANLISNAVRYTPCGGRVEVGVRRDDNQAIVTVADTGVGISEEDIGRVFDRFWRADAARATATGGLGIGLAVTKEIIERHRGQIGVERRVTGGTAFTIRLPLR